jgi:plastocyanin
MVFRRRLRLSSGRALGVASSLLLALAVVGPPVAASEPDQHSKSPATYTVLVGLSRPERGVNVDAYFPDNLTVHLGDSVKFKQNAAEIHTVTFLAPSQTPPDLLATFPLLDPAVWRPVVPANHQYDGTSYANSGIMSTDPSYSLPGQQVTSFWLRFTHAGSYQYFCIVHGMMMTGTINVVDPSVKIPSPGKVRHQVKTTIAGLLKQVPAAIRAAKAAIIPPVHHSDGTTTYNVNVGFMYGMIDLMSFFPGKLEVHPGDTVVWHMTTVPHTITFLNGNPEPSLIVPAMWPPTSAPTVMFNPAILGPSASVVTSQPLNKTDMFHSGFLPVPNATFSLTIGNIEGPVPYLCLLHDASGMVGKLVVEAADEHDEPGH